MIRYSVFLSALCTFASSVMAKETVALSLILLLTANASAELAGHWKFDENSGTIVADSSGNGNDGTLYGNPLWVSGKIGSALQFDGTYDYVQVNRTIQDDMTMMGWIKTAPSGFAGPPRVAWQGCGLFWSDVIGTANDFIVSVYDKKLIFCCREDNTESVKDVVTGDWVHVAVTRKIVSSAQEDVKIYIDGELDKQASYSIVASLNANNIINIGGNTLDNRYYKGLIDDVRFYTNCLTQEEITEIIINNLSKGAASSPIPQNRKAFVAQDVTLSWLPGIYAYTHNVFFGTDFNDVNNASVGKPLGATLYKSLDVNSIAISRLEFNTTYYWRVEEVNAPSKPGTYKGQVWQFTTEPYAYKIPSNKITTTAISSYRNKYPNSTVNESGLDPNNMDLHSSNTSTMWLSSGYDSEPVWIRYDFDKTYKLDEMFVWNYNAEGYTGYGFKNVIVQYTEDGNNWNLVPDVNEFTQAPGTGGYKYNTIVDFNGVLAKSVKITAFSNWSGGSLNYYGLSEVRFMYIPSFSRLPVPASGATNVPIDITLSWRPGHEATEHDFYFSTDEQAVTDGNIPLIRVTEPNYGPLSLILDTTYYWRVDEINDSESHSVWPGDTWNFTTQKFFIVDDFENYNDSKPNRIFDFYTDGRNDPLNGSIIGYSDPNLIAGEHYMETSIFHSGFQSVPLSYDNTVASYSEVTIDVNKLAISSNWTIGNPEFLVLWFFGDPCNSITARIYIKINGFKIEYDGDQGDISSPKWHQWNIDLVGINLGIVTSFSLGVEKTEETGGSGKILIDDICLYRNEPDKDICIEAECADSIISPLMIYDDPNAFGGQYITVLSGNNSTDNPPAPSGTASYIFEVTGGKYRVQARVLYGIDRYNSDSCWIRINGAAVNTIVHTSGWIQWNNIVCSNTTWDWDTVRNMDDGNKLVEFSLNAGTYTLEIGYREDGLYLDAILITKID